MNKIKVGVVSTFFPKISVAEVSLGYEIFSGDHLCFMTEKGEKYISVGKIIVEDGFATNAQAGQTVGLKIDFPVRVGCEVVKQLS